MVRPSPMDRLLFGDVGFGKTEVALRSAFKCIADGKQCAILVPTTVLAMQHYQPAMRRMEPFPVRVEMLSRFVSPTKQKQILEDLAHGGVDLLVGTHRIINIFFNLRKADNFFKPLVNFFFFQTENSRVDINVFTAGHIRVKSRT